MNGCRRCAANGLDEVVHAGDNSILVIFRDLSNVLNEERRELSRPLALTFSANSSSGICSYFTSLPNSVLWFDSRARLSDLFCSSSTPFWDDHQSYSW
jgi:hypothetical protein